jgi:hypothetical protein
MGMDSCLSVGGKMDLVYATCRGVAPVSTGPDHSHPHARPTKPGRCMVGKRRTHPAALVLGVDGQHDHLSQEPLLVADRCRDKACDPRVLVCDPGPDREV